MNQVILKFLKAKGYNPVNVYYGNIDIWKQWYENYVSDFHKYHDHNGDVRQIYRLGMAKRGCEDWSSILFTERDELVCDNSNNQNYLNEQLDKMKFTDNVADNIENAFWSGTVATILRVKNARVVNKQIVADENTYTEMINVTADKIVPLRVDNGRILDVAFVSETLIENERAYYIEIHELKGEEYIIHNYFCDENGEEKENASIVKEYHIPSKTPLFSILKPKIVNNIREATQNGLGISVYANAIDQLMSCDITYNNFVKDYELGGKKVFYNKKLVKYNIQTITDNETGETITKEIPVYPDDITKQQFQVVGDEMDNINESPLITEYNPDLRTQQNEEGVNFALNIYAFKLGLGKGYYRFENGTVVTATQYLGENKDLVGNAKKHRTSVNEYTQNLAKSVLLLGRILFKQNVTEDDVITLTDKDGFLISDEELQDRYRQDLQAGLISKKTYLMKARGMTKEQAIAELELINQDNPTVDQLIEKE